MPDRFTVRVQPRDLDELDGVGGLAVDLASHALEWARRRGYGLDERPRVAIVGDDQLRPGDIDVEARFSGQGTKADSQHEQNTSTSVFQAPIVRSRQATLDVLEPSGRRRTFVSSGVPVTIGRGADNGLHLVDDGVSRHHARLQARGGMLILSDLGSTNGTRVNGHLITEVALGHGDVVEVGDSFITIVAIDGV